MGIALWIGETKLWTARAVRTFPAFRLAVGAKRLKGVVCPQCFDTGCVVGAAVCGQPHAGANPQARFKLVVRQMEKIGVLRQSSTPEADKPYWMALSNGWQARVSIREPSATHCNVGCDASLSGAVSKRKSTSVLHCVVSTPNQQNPLPRVTIAARVSAEVQPNLEAT